MAIGTSSLTITPLHPAFAAEVSGVDLTRRLDEATFEPIALAFDEYSVLVFHGQPLTDGNATAVQFVYYPQQTSGTAPAPYCFSAGNPSGCSGTLGLSLMNVQQIRISLTVQSKSPDVQFGGQPNVTMSSSADLRNHGLSS